MSDIGKAPSLPPWRTVSPDDPRERDGAMEPSEFVSGEWASSIGASSNRAWSNAAKVVAAMGEAQPDVRYVEGWAAHGGVGGIVWHAWVDVPLGSSGRSWLRIDATPSWRWTIKHNRYAPVLEVRASDMLEFVAPMRRPRGRARCRLPLVPLVHDPTGSYRQPMPIPTIAAEFGSTVAARSAQARMLVQAHQRTRTAELHVDGLSELDRLRSLGLLPSLPTHPRHRHEER